MATNERPPQYEFEIVLPYGNRTLKAESVAVIAGCLIVFNEMPILCYAPGAWVSAERMWDREIEEVADVR